LQATLLRIGQLGEALPHRNRVVGNRNLQFLPTSLNLDKAGAFGRANALDTPARELSFVGHVEQPILETRRTEIGNQDFHACSPPEPPCTSLLRQSSATSASTT
jgi:hypothetical protein